MNYPKDEADAQAALAELDGFLATRGMHMGLGEGGCSHITGLWKKVNMDGNLGMTPKLTLAMMVRELQAKIQALRSDAWESSERGPCA